MRITATVCTLVTALFAVAQFLLIVTPCHSATQSKPFLFLTTYGSYREKDPEPLVPKSQGITKTDSVGKYVEILTGGGRIFTPRHAQSFFAGSMMMLTITPEPRGFKELADSLCCAHEAWPQGLTITAGLTGANGEFQPSAQLTRQLNIEYLKEHDRCKQHFLFMIPSDFSGPSFQLEAQYVHPTLGTIDGMNHPVIAVVLPKTNADSNLAWDSIIKFVMRTYDLPRLIALADSFVRQGYRGSQGLKTAQGAAEKLQDWDEALKFFDLNFQMNGKDALRFLTVNMSQEQQFEEYTRVHLRLLSKQPEYRKQELFVIP